LSTTRWKPHSLNRLRRFAKRWDEVALTPRQKRFVSEYIIDLNATQAALRAGYSQKAARQQGQRLLTYAAVAQAIAESQEKRAKATEITAERVLAVIDETIQRCRQATPVVDKAGNPVMVETADGQIVPAYTFDAAGVLKGAELLGKHIGLFPNKVNWQGQLNVVNEAAVPRPQDYDAWLRYQQQPHEPAQVIALPAPEKANGG
jgi:phage terminase small subunit